MSLFLSHKNMNFYTNYEYEGYPKVSGLAAWSESCRRPRHE